MNANALKKDQVYDDEEDITFENFDKFKRKEFADQLTRVISTFYPFYDEAFVLSLNARFGSGKTTFLKMWENQLRADGYKVVSVNAWETDFDDEPILPIVSSILDGIDNRKDVEKTLTETLKNVVGASALFGSQILKHNTGVDLYAAGKAIEAEIDQTNVKKLGDALYKEYDFKVKAYKAVKRALSEYISTLENKPFIVLVDELDRARPDYAVRFLESIKHIFPVPGVCFVLAVDRGQLAASVKQLYGQVDFENYYRRFITREAHLAVPQNVDLLPFIEYLSKEFFDEKMSRGIAFPFQNNERNEAKNFIAMISTACQLSPREIQSLFRAFSQLMAVTAKTQQVVKVSWLKGAIFMIAIFIKDRSLYHRLGTNKATPGELIKFLEGLDYKALQNDYDERYIAVTCFSMLLREDHAEENSQIADYFMRYERPVENPQQPEIRKEIIGRLARQLDDFGILTRASGYKQIYDVIEKWLPFIR